MDKQYWDALSDFEKINIVNNYTDIAKQIRQLVNKKANSIKSGKFSNADNDKYQIDLKILQDKYNNFNIWRKCPVCGTDVYCDIKNLKKLFKDSNLLIFCSKKCSGKYYANKQHLTETIEQKQERCKKISETLKNKEIKLTEAEKIQRSKRLNSFWKDMTPEERSLRNKKCASKAKQTKLEKYGNENYNNSTQIGISFRQHYNENNLAPNWSHIGAENLKIIRNRELFKNFILSTPIETRCIATISEKLNISRSYCSSLINTYNLYQDTDFHIHRNISKPQIELENYIKSLYGGTIISNDRQTIKPLELDIYIPDKNVAIEYNGNYHHCIANVDKYLHYKKSKMCEEIGIRLIHIFEYEWENERQRPILENIIKSALGITQTIYARKLKIVEKPSAELRDFFDINNIQGFRGGKTAICLTDEVTNEVYMAYIMGNAFFGKGKYQWEVIRGATKLGYTVVGGASKIWKYFIDTYNPDSCVYYVDYNYFNGKSLENLPNMELIDTQYSFKNYWVKEGVVKNREPARHHEIMELEKQGLVYPIYNAGTKVYVWKKSS